MKWSTTAGGWCVIPDPGPTSTDILNWCVEQFGSEGSWSWGSGDSLGITYKIGICELGESRTCFVFTDMKEAAIFVLRWGDKLLC